MKYAHPEYHAIKKESIGLIEAQGLFILPGRLEEQLQDIEKIIEAKKQLPPPPPNMPSLSSYTMKRKRYTKAESVRIFIKQCRKSLGVYVTEY